MQVREANLHKVGEQHYHVMLGEDMTPTHNTSFDSFDLAVDAFLALVKEYYPDFFIETEASETEVRETLFEKAMDSTFDEQRAKVLISIGDFKIGFADCFGCLFPWYS